MKRLVTFSTFKRLVTFSTAVACLGTFAALGLAQAAEAPRNTVRPIVTGDPTVGRVLTANRGTWTGDPAPTFTYRWLRCNRAGLGCGFIPRAAGETYTVRLADVGRRIRTAVTATNTTGTNTVRSPATPIVVGSGSGGGAPAGSTVAIQNVSLPQRLIADRVEFSPNPVTSRATPITVRVHISDTRGRSVSGALVFLRSTPILTQTPPELATGGDGWATFSVQPRANFPLRRGYNVQFFVRARKAGENTLAGVSTRRLVQVATAAA